jgi:hypothetical protein
MVLLLSTTMIKPQRDDIANRDMILAKLSSAPSQRLHCSWICS